MDLQKIKSKDILENVKVENEMFSLTDLWKLAGSDPQRTPAKWQESEPVQRFLQTACKFLNVGISDIIKSKRGKGGGTWGHKQVALEYSQYLDPNYAVLVNQVFFERVEEEKNPDLIVDRYVKTYKKRGLSDEWINKRIQSVSNRNFFTETLARHGCDKNGYRNCTNAVYENLYGGSSTVVREKKGLTSKDKIRDNMSSVELQSVMLAELLAANAINDNNIRGNAKCEMTTRKASASVKKSLMDFKRSISNQNNF